MRKAGCIRLPIGTSPKCSREADAQPQVLHIEHCGGGHAGENHCIKPLAPSNPASLVKIIVQKSNPGVLDKMHPDSSLLVSACEAGAEICIINRLPGGTDPRTALPEPTSTSLGRGLCVLVRVGAQKPLGKACGGRGGMRAQGSWGCKGRFYPLNFAKSWSSC